MKPALLLMTICLLCSCSAVPAPSGNKFACGMSVKEMETVTRSPCRLTWGGMRDFDIYTTKGKFGHYHFYVHEEGGLKYITNTQAWGLKETRLSPLRNVCNGELAFQVDVRWSVALAGSIITVNGVRVADAVRAYRVILSEGQHEISMIKEGYGPLVKELTFTAQDRGDHRITFSAGDLVPESEPGN